LDGLGRLDGLGILDGLDSIGVGVGAFNRSSRFTSVDVGVVATTGICSIGFQALSWS